MRVAPGHRAPSARAVVLACAAVLASLVGGLVAPAIAATSASSGSAASASPAQVFAGGLYVDRGSEAARAVTRLRAAGDSASAESLRRISEVPTAVWLGDWASGDALRAQIGAHVAAARGQGATAVFVTYAVPNRDCGGYSSGGLSTSGYAEWNAVVASALRGTGSVVLVEPDGLALLGDCPAERSRRVTAISGAVDTLTAAGVTVYLDAGHSDWRSAADMAQLLREAGVAKARGFVTNVSNFQPLAAEQAYGERLSALLGGARYVIDVSRNGTGSQGEWCNPVGASIGQHPLIASGRTGLDAVLWVKRPGESDGTCRGAPGAGAWSDALALDLVRNSARASGVSPEAAYACRSECG